MTHAPAPAVASVRHMWRSRRRSILVFVMLVLAFGLVVGLSLVQSSPSGRVLGAEDASPSGSQAVVRVLEQQGVSVHSADTLEQAAALVDQYPQATVLLYDGAGMLTAGASHRTAEVAERIPAGRLVLVAPNEELLEAVTTGITSAGQIDPHSVLSAGDRCDWAAAREADTVVGGGLSYRYDDAHAADELCFPLTEGAASATESPESVPYAVLRDADGTVVVGSSQLFTNEWVGREGNAVVALWSVARSEHVIWYLPTSGDLRFDEADQPSILPDWVGPAGWWLVVCALVFMVWRGRRHGPVVVEPLPVHVAATESTTGRARLHQRAGHYNSAVETLQQATLRRLAHRLRLGVGVSAETVVAATARAVGEDEMTLWPLFDHRRQHTATSMVETAVALKALERMIRTPTTDLPQENS